MREEYTVFIQGNLQAVFDALYEVGAIDPVLKMDWSEVTKAMEQAPFKVEKAVKLINGCGGNMDLIRDQLLLLDSQSLHFIAMEVAREFAEFQDRKDLH